jgi:integrase
MSNQKINTYLKEIADILGIEKRVTHHTARKTFAASVLLNYDVPMEIVSELLGHSSIKITQEYYGKIVQRRVSEEIMRIAKRLE